MNCKLVFHILGLVQRVEAVLMLPSAAIGFFCGTGDGADILLSAAITLLMGQLLTLLPREGGAALTDQVFNVPDQLPAPIKQGDIVGTVTLTIEGETIGTADLIAGSDVSRNQLLYTISRVSLFFSSTYFKVVVILTMLVIGAYLIFTVGRILRIWSKEV